MDETSQIPVVVIVGRPNVGKSSLLNALARRRIAIVHSTSGVTRDRVAALIEHGGQCFEIWDTGGMGAPDEAALEAEIKTQIDIALRRADLILFVVDARQGYTQADLSVAARLRRTGRPLVLAANKADDAQVEANLPEFYRLGMGDPVAVSAMHGFGRTELLDRMIEALPATAGRRDSEELVLAIVGRQNAGKSTLVNRLAAEERMIVHEMPGTTRDSVDVRFDWQGRRYLVIDTAGLKRRSRKGSSIDFYAAHRTDRSIRRADVVFLMIDASSRIGRTDRKIAAYVESQVRPCVVVVNKWDLAGGVTTGEYLSYLNQELRVLHYAPVVFISALEGTNVAELLDIGNALHRQAGVRVSTGELNRALEHAERPPAKAGRIPRLLYGTQVRTRPPTFVVFVSRASQIADTYRRYLANFLRERFGFGEVPLRIYFRTRRRPAGNRSA